jgi:O-antigen/teichoic acid export membrane protein
MLFGTLLFVPTVLMTSLFPMAARLAKESTAELVALIRRALRFLLLCGVPIGLGTLALARPVCILLFGSEFAESGPVLAVYGALMVLLFPLIALSYHAIVTGQQRRWAVFVLVGILLTIPLDLILVPWCDQMFGNGAIAGALSYLITEAVSLALAMRFTARGVVDRSVMRRAGMATFAGLLMLLVVWPVRFAPLPVPVLLGALIYSATIIATRTLDADERQMIAAMTNRILGKVRRAS